MDNDFIAAGNNVDGKEKDQRPRKLTGGVRKARIADKPGTIIDETTQAVADMTPSDNALQGDDYFKETLLRFGIQI